MQVRVRPHESLQAQATQFKSMDKVDANLSRQRKLRNLGQWK